MSRHLKYTCMNFIFNIIITYRSFSFLVEDLRKFVQLKVDCDESTFDFLGKVDEI